MKIVIAKVERIVVIYAHPIPSSTSGTVRSAQREPLATKAPSVMISVSPCRPVQIKTIQHTTVSALEARGRRVINGMIQNIAILTVE